MSLRKATPAALALGLLLSAASGRADTVDTTVTTLLTGRADARDGQLHTIIPIYESIGALATLSVPHTDGMRMVFSGWGGVIVDVPAGQPANQSWTGDIDVGYLEGRFFQGGIQLRLGRQFITGGAARFTALDGASVVLRLFRGLHLSGYGGAPVTPRFAVSRGDATFGGRLYYRFSTDAELGVSYNQVLDVGQMARQDLAVDAHLRVARTLWLTGYTLLSLREQRLAEADFTVNWQPRAAVQVSAEYRRTAPDLFLPLNSVFAVFSQETRDEAGFNLYLRPDERVRIYGDYHVVIDADGVGHRGGAKLSVYLGEHNDHSINAEGRTLELPTNGYFQARLFSMHNLTPAFMATLGLDMYFLNHAINEQTRSFTGTGTVAWQMTKSLRLVASAMGDRTPFMQRRFEGVLKLAYNATRRFREVHP